jgi:hypothetical protein
MERAYLDYSRLRCSKPDTGAANAFAAVVGVAQSILKRFQPELTLGRFSARGVVFALGWEW